MGHIRRDVPALTIATLLLGPCFQWVFNRQLLGLEPFAKTDEQFANELIQRMLTSISPS